MRRAGATATRTYRRSYVTREGVAHDDDWPVVGRCRDDRRIRYLHLHLQALHEAIDVGVDVLASSPGRCSTTSRWAWGCDMRFGLVHLDYATQTRTIRDSGPGTPTVPQQHRAWPLSPPSRPDPGALRSTTNGSARSGSRERNGQGRASGPHRRGPAPRSTGRRMRGAASAVRSAAVERRAGEAGDTARWKDQRIARIIAEVADQVVGVGTRTCRRLFSIPAPAYAQQPDRAVVAVHVIERNPAREERQPVRAWPRSPRS